MYNSYMALLQYVSAVKKVLLNEDADAAMADLKQVSDSR
jgi:hypothetical protein